MKQRKTGLKVLFASIGLILIAIFNVFTGWIVLPDTTLMVDRQIDFITISTVFAGFSFTALGLLLGMSSEQLIKKRKYSNCSEKDK